MKSKWTITIRDHRGNETEVKIDAELVRLMGKQDQFAAAEKRAKFIASELQSFIFAAALMAYDAR